MSVARYIEMGRMDELGRMDTPLHRLDPRAKVIATGAFIVAVMSFPRHEVSALMPFFVYPFALMAAGNLPAGYVLGKIALAAPFALCVGLLNPVLDRQPMAMIGSHAISGGWLSYASILIRFTLTVGAALILVASTGMQRLCAGLERLGMPRVFAVQLLMLHRYFFVVGDEGLRMVRGVRMRTTGGQGLRWRTYKTLVGNLLLRSLDRAQRIYRSMVARGFDGEVRLLHRTTAGWKEVAFVIGWGAFFALARVWNLAERLGHWMAGGGS